MSDERDIYRAAKLLIDRFGPLDGEIHAAQRADELLTDGDMEGQRIWLRILEAVRELSGAGSGTVH